MMGTRRTRPAPGIARQALGLRRELQEIRQAATGRIFIPSAIRLAPARSLYGVLMEPLPIILR